MYVFGLGRPGQTHLRVALLPDGVPINGDVLFPQLPDARGKIPPVEWSPSGRAYPQSQEREILNSEWFRTYGSAGPGERTLRTYFLSRSDYWNADQAVLGRAGVDAGVGPRGTFWVAWRAPGWKTIYETAPCLPIHGENRRHGIPFVGYFGGGRMALLDAQTLLLTVGDFGFDGVASVQAHAQDAATSYGKTVAINIADGRTSAVQSQVIGILRASTSSKSGSIWSTEHGPQGGDELNRLVRGANYGWPLRDRTEPTMD